MNRIFASTALALFLLASATLFASSGQTSRSLALPDAHFLQSTTDKPSTKGSFSLALPDVHFLQSTTDKPSTKGSFSLRTSSVQLSQISVLPVANNYTTVSKYGKKSIMLSIFDKGVITEQQYAAHIARRNALLIKRS